MPRGKKTCPVCQGSGLFTESPEYPCESRPPANGRCLYCDGSGYVPSRLNVSPKSADGKSRSTVSSSAKFKAEAVGTEGLIYVTVMEPGVVDAQGDTYTADEVKKAAHRFAHKGLVEKCDVNHNNHAAPEFVIAESYILKTEDKDHFPATKPGSWVAVLKCEDLNSDLWQKVVKGQFNGVSIAGSAEGDLAQHPDPEDVASAQPAPNFLEMALTPRLNKVLASGKNFLIVTETEPYYLRVFAMVRAQEQSQGTWTPSDEDRYINALQQRITQLEQSAQSAPNPRNLRSIKGSHHA